MDWVRAVILGIVQGATEFLPISSSGHLVLVPALFDWPDQGLAFDVGLHLGTLTALLVYFWRDWLRMLDAGVRDVASHRLALRSYRPDSRLLLLIAAGTIPAAAGGLLFDDWIEAHTREVWLVTLTLAGGAALLWWADRAGAKTRQLGDLRWRDAVITGLAQASALIPGVSRSGITMTGALFLGFDRNTAARYAFLLGTPAFIGAAILKLPDLAGESGRDLAELAVGFAFSAAVGLAVIAFLLRWLRTRSLAPFVVYRLGVVAVTIVIALARMA